MNNLKALFLEDSDYQRLDKLSTYFKKNNTIKGKFIDLFNLQKEIVKLKLNNDFENLKIKEGEYNKIKTEILDIPFAEEYFDLLSDLKVDLDCLKKEIIKKIERNHNLM